MVDVRCVVLISSQVRKCGVVGLRSLRNARRKWSESAYYIRYRNPLTRRFSNMDRDL